MKIALVDRTVGFIIKHRLKRLGFEPIELPKSKLVTDAVATHPDIALFRHGDTVITNEDYLKSEANAIFKGLRSSVASLRIITSDEVPASPYPGDAIFNALVIRGKIFCHTKSVSRTVLRYAEDSGLKIVDVKQGYPACTVLKLNDDAAITADRGMAKALIGEGIKVTLIDDGGILLPPYKTGFIGGAATVYNGCVYFLGNPAWHPSYGKIKAAIKDAGLRMTCLSPFRPRDKGGIVFFDNDIDNNGEDGN